ncbi:hypothetical protein Droror1_Dr00022299 [Drosera rotundifolia]
MAQAKFEKEQKTLKLEVDLKQTKLNSAVAAKQLQEEFGKHSEKLEFKFDENEKLAVEAQREASDLRYQITAMAEEHQKANNELLSIKDDYGIKERKLSGQLIAQKNEFDQLLQNLEDECTKLKVSKQNAEENSGILLMENENLIIDVQRLIERDNHLSEQLEQIEDLRSQMEQMKTSFNEREAEEKGDAMERRATEKDIVTVGREEKSKYSTLEEEEYSKEKVLQTKADGSEYDNKEEKGSQVIHKKQQQQLQLLM